MTIPNPYVATSSTKHEWSLLHRRIIDGKVKFRNLGKFVGHLAEEDCKLVARLLNENWNKGE